mmetsp:Transcript_130950/g.355390  ORF Transcript_130950/g.355390 Transcript_130950/m.355390 type:complete len:96 (+) Transcript_130950:713-1000(+)
MCNGNTVGGLLGNSVPTGPPPAGTAMECANAAMDCEGSCRGGGDCDLTRMVPSSPCLGGSPRPASAEASLGPGIEAFRDTCPPKEGDGAYGTPGV